MKIAFDVKGTLDGYNEEKVRRLFKWFQDQGHEVHIWSNSFSYAHEMAVKLNHPLKLVHDKYSFYDAKEMDKTVFDFCVEDDTNQWYLASKKFIWVHNVPENPDSYNRMMEEAPCREDLQ